MEKPGTVEFSLCGIYKNEEKNLEKFITHHFDSVEEMVLVDTGSTDRSNEIVKTHGLEYHFFRWTSNFSEARNFSLSLAAKPWIIVLDMDELVLKEDFTRLKEIMNCQKKDAYSLRQINFTDTVDDLNWKSIHTLPPTFHSTAAGYIESPLIRVFRNFKGVCFHGAIHELVGESIHRLNLSGFITDIPIYHFGWIASARSDTEKQKKKKAYVELIKREWEKDPSPKMAFYYISTLDNHEEKLRLSFKLTHQYPEVKQFWEIMSHSAAALKQYERAISYAEKGLELHPGHVPLLILKARCLNETGQPQQALDIVEGLLMKDAKNPISRLEKFRSLVLLKRKDEANAFLKEPV